MKVFDIQSIVKVLNNSKTGYLTFKQIASLVLTQSSAERQQLDAQLKTACKEGVLIYDNTNNRYSLPQSDTFQAVVDMQPRGYCFLIQQGVDKDYFVPAKSTAGAMHRDVVLARKVEGGDDEAEIVSIVSRGITELVGTVDKGNGHVFVIADDKKYSKDVYISPKCHLNAKHGQKVVVKITGYPTDSNHKPEGEVIQILGYAGQHDADMLSVAYSCGIRDKFPPEVLERASKISAQVDPQDIAGRVDLRDQLIITIDGDDAKDLDDAISIDIMDNGNYRLGVHIADVSHYVKPGDDIDIEAYKRGTSTYLPQMVFPMLPTSLSNGICSLFQGVDRLTLSCFMQMDSKGDVVDFEVVNSVIRSRHRMTYTDVQAILDGDQQLTKKYCDIVPMLNNMSLLASILIDRRNRKGNIDFASKEVKFITDDKGRVIDIVPYQTLFSHRIIEQFMVSANETVAQYALHCDVPFMYRVHEKPDEEKLAMLIAMLKGLGINIAQSHAMHSSALQKALLECEGKPYFNMINSVMLRTMQKAKYSDDNIGHYGLASSCYCHFTSPIRRYPDLIVHRVLKTLIAGKMTQKAINAYAEICSEGSVSCSIAERKAEEAERKAVDVKVCQYASTLVGQSFAGNISGVTEHGIFVELPNTIEGFVRVDNLVGYGYKYDRQKYQLTNGILVYSLGDEIIVTIESVNTLSCRIDMTIANAVDKENQK